MRAGESFPDDQAEIVVSDHALDQMASLTESQRVDVLADIENLCRAPGGKHPLHAPLPGWNTLSVLPQTPFRVVYHATVEHGVGTVFVLCLAPRRDNEVYDIATALVELLSPDDAQQLWDALAALDLVAEQIGLDGWDYTPEPAPEGLQRAAVATGVLSADRAAVLSSDELSAALRDGWGENGPDPLKALHAALEQARRGVGFDSADVILRERADDRCGVVMPRAHARCVRRRGHPGAHRSRS